VRHLRVNEIIKREVSDILHTTYRDQTAHVTIIDVSTTPDLRQSHVYYSVIGSPEAVDAARHFFTAHHKRIRKALSQRIVLKYLPNLHFHKDDAMARGNHLINLLDQLEQDAVDPAEELPEGEEPHR
jgi:ribosome-binding factor A